jgi:hypothetical protein
MAKDEGNGGSGGQILARFRSDLSGEMSLQLPSADDNGPGRRDGAADTFRSRAVLSPLRPRANLLRRCREPLAAKPFAPIRPNEPLVTARGDNR